MNSTIESRPDAALKYQRVLRRLLDGPLNRFEAEAYPVSDHTLPSTVSELKRRGVTISAQLVRLPGYDGRGVHVAEYRLAEESRQRALQLIGECQ